MLYIGFWSGVSTTAIYNFARIIDNNITFCC